MEEAFDAWCKLQTRKHVIPDALHAEMIRGLAAPIDRSNHKVREWLKRKLFVRSFLAETRLWMRVDRAVRLKVNKKEVIDVTGDTPPSSASSASDASPPRVAPPRAAAAAASAAAAAASAPITSWKEVLVPKQSQVLDIIRALHAHEKHIGSRNTHRQLEKDYGGIPRKVVEAVITRCPECIRKASRKPNQKPAICAINSAHFNHRCQIDLFDMQKTPGGPKKDYRYVLHYLDHYSRFSILRPIKDKSMETVATVVEEIWCLFGPPEILQSDNGSEFVNERMRQLRMRYRVVWKHSRPYHPQSQGAVERANAFAKQLLRGWIASQVKDIDWIPGLTSCQATMNDTKRDGTKRSPYELVFNRPYGTTVQRMAELDQLVKEDKLDLFPDGESAAGSDHGDEQPMDLDATDAVADAAEVRHGEMTAAAAASSQAYKVNMVEKHNAKASTYEAKPGDFIAFKLQKKHISALDLQRAFGMVLEVTRGSCRIWTEQGLLDVALGLSDLMPAPESMRPAGLTWSLVDLRAECAQAKRNGSKIEVSMAEIVASMTHTSAAPAELTSDQKMQIIAEKKKEKDRADKKRKKAEKDAQGSGGAAAASAVSKPKAKPRPAAAAAASAEHKSEENPNKKQKK
jgi:transposase InsO family protein